LLGRNHFSSACWSSPFLGSIAKPNQDRQFTRLVERYRLLKNTRPSDRFAQLSSDNLSSWWMVPRIGLATSNLTRDGNPESMWPELLENGGRNFWNPQGSSFSIVILFYRRRESCPATSWSAGITCAREGTRFDSDIPAEGDHALTEDVWIFRVGVPELDHHMDRCAVIDVMLIPASAVTRIGTQPSLR